MKPRSRSLPPVLAAVAGCKGTKNSFPWLRAQPAQSPTVRASSSELGKRTHPPANPAEPSVIPPDANEELLEEDGWTRQRFSRGKKSAGRPREPSRSSSRVPTPTAKRKTSFPKEFAQDGDEIAEEEVVVIKSSSSESENGKDDQIEKNKRSEVVEAANETAPTPKEPRLSKTSPPHPLDCKASLPDYVVVSKKRTWKSVAAKGKASQYDNPKSLTKNSSGSESEKEMQGCKLPPNFDQNGGGSGSDGDVKHPKRHDPQEHPPARFPQSNISPKKPAGSHPPPKRQLKPSDLLEFEAKLSVHASSKCGACLFDSLSSSLCYLLEHHPSSFNFSRFPSSKKTIQAFHDKQVLRKALTDHAMFRANEIFQNLGGLTPTEAVQRDYVDGKQPLHDPEWYEKMCQQTPAPQISQLPISQPIYSFSHYISAMRQPCANGDEIMLAMFCDLFNLRVVVAELTEESNSVQMEHPGLILATTSLDIIPELPLSSDFTVTLILSNQHYDWAHLSSGMCSEPSSHCAMDAASEVACYTTTPIVYCDNDPDFYTPVCEELLRNNSKNVRRSNVMDCLIYEHNAIPEEAELTTSTFEKLGGIASMATLPELLHLHKATTYRPPKASFLPENAHATLADASRNRRDSQAQAEESPPARPSKLVQSNNQSRLMNELRHASSTLQSQITMPRTFATERLPSLASPEFIGAANAVQLITNCNLDIAISAIKRHCEAGLNYMQAVTNACQELKAPPEQTRPSHNAALKHRPPQVFNTEVSFIEQHLGEGIREMTTAELVTAEAALDQALSSNKGNTVMPPMSALVPKNLNNYWLHHLSASATTPRGAMTLEQHARAVRKMASTALHYEACAAASAMTPTLTAQAPARVAADFQPPQPDSSNFRTPLSSDIPQTSAAISTLPDKYSTHTSPYVRMAAAHAEQVQSARAAATTVVVMSSNSSKLMQWKGGEEKDCRGFNWSTKLAVQQAWEQHNTTEDVHGYKSFRSCIHCTMLPIICAELSMTRLQFDKITDAELIDKIDKLLKPTGPADYLIKMRSIKFDTTEPSKTSLLHRYRAFAEPFLQLLAEATEAGCQINNESVKLAFREQCRGSQLMMMWLQEENWTTTSAAHQRIMTHLKSYNTLLTLQSLNNQQALPPTPAIAAPQQQQQQVPVAVPPLQQVQIPPPPAGTPLAPLMPYYTPQQRADFKQRQQKNGVVAQQGAVFQPQAPAPQQHQQHQQQQANPHFQQAPMVNNVMAPQQQQHQERQANPLFHPAPIVNNVMAPQQQQHQERQANPLFHPAPIVNNIMSPPPAPAPALYVQPGTDQRGPDWHPIGPKCRFTPCNSPFCQGCGEHGHSVADCKKRGKHANWNYSGYYVEQRPNQPALIYDGPAKYPQQFPNAAPAIPPFPTPYQTGRPVPPPQPTPARSYTPVARTNVTSQHSDPSPKIAHHFGCLGGQLARLLWDPGCSDELITPAFARKFIERGAPWEYVEPLAINHGNSEVVTSGKPSTVKVQLDVLIVHRGLVFQQNKVWFYVYEGSLPDAMISDTLLNTIPCITAPGTTLVDTRAREGDMSILLQQIHDYQDLCNHRVNTALLRSDDIPVSEPRQPVSANNCSASPGLPPEGFNINSAQPLPPHTDIERINSLLAEMTAQRARLVARLGTPVSPEALQACLAVLDRFPDNFRPPGTDPCKLGIYKIVLKDKSKFHVALPRRVNPIMLAEIRRQVEELVAVGSIERCVTRPSSVYAIVMARRPNAPGKYRLCVDLSPGNDNTVPNPYAVPEIQQALDRLSGHKLYSTFDFSSWFSQFELAEEDRDKMAFVVPGDNLTPPQIYRYKRVCFGALNATYFCQRQLQEALKIFPGCESIYPFVDDIVIFADSLQEMLDKLESFMRFCQQNNLRLNKSKTELASSAVRHVGFILSEEGQSLDPARVDSLMNIGAPRNLDGLKSLLGSFGFIRGWLADMAGTAAPLTDLMSNTAHRLKFEWGPKQDTALAALKLAVNLAPAKMAPDYGLPFEVYVDASDVGVAAVLVQWRYDPEGNLIPMAILHKSRRWADREAKWEVACREMYALRYGLFEFREYLQGCPNVSVFSDHLNLVNGLWKHSNPKIVRWRMFLESMRPFTLRHIKGTDQMQMAADALSRLHVRNLTLQKNEEEKDPAIIRMMERGEGEDDEQMFSDATFTHSAQTQTEFLHSLYNSTTSTKVTRAPTAQEQTLADTYGVGFDIIDQTGWSETSNTAPVQLKTQLNRAGLGYKNVHPDHPLQRRNPATNHANLALCTLPATNTHNRILSCAHIADWEDAGERSSAFEECSSIFSAANSQHLSANASTRSKTRSTAPPTHEVTKKQKLSPEHPTAATTNPLSSATTNLTSPEHPAAVIADTQPSLTSSSNLPDRTAAISSNLPTATISSDSAAASTSDIPPNQAFIIHAEASPLSAISASEPLPTAAILALRNLPGTPESSAAVAPLPAAASSQTTPQDFRDTAYKASGGFPLLELLKKAHDSTHPGFVTTWRRVIRAVGAQSTPEAAKTKNEVRRYCDACLCCQKLQPARSKLFADVGSIRQRPFTSYAFDVITLSHPDSNGIRYILCCVDSFSRAVELYGLAQANAPSVLECLIDVLSRWGRSAELRCDNAKAFTSAMVTALLKRAKVTQHLTAPYSHQSNGQVENCNRRVMDVLRAMILDDRLGPNTQMKWSWLLPEVRRILMTRTITQHGLTPNDLAYMHCPETESSIFEEEAWLQPLSSEAEHADPEWLVKPRQQHEILIDICDERQSELLQKLADKNEAARGQQQQPMIQVHDFVLLKLTDRPQQKAQPRWAGPYLVVAFPDNDPTRQKITLQHLSTKIVGDFHTNMLKRCDMSLMQQVDDAIPYAAKDCFEYEIEDIIQHTPAGPRRTATGLRSKSDYEFRVLWKDIPLGPDNPSWEPWTNESIRSCAPYLAYVQRPDIIASLGTKF
jgi:transposase InsO family protein